MLSGNRNFEGRIHPLVRANCLASPPLVVVYALAGTTLIDLASEPLGTDSDGELLRQQINSAMIHYPSGEQCAIELLSRLDTSVEVEYFRAGGVLTYVLDRIAASGQAPVASV